MMRIADSKTPVVVIQFARGLAHAGLGIMRSLGRQGISVYVVNSDSRSPASSSRYCRRQFLWDIDQEHPEDSVERLVNLGRKIGPRPVLIPTTHDAAALFVADNARFLKDAFIFPDQPPSLVRALASKKEMYFLAKRFGIPTPETSFPQTRFDVARFLEHATFPVMLKGIDGVRLQKRTGKKMVIVRDQQELLDTYDALEEPGNPNLMLQEYIPGGDDTIWMFNGYFNKDSDCLVGFTGKKIRQFPVYTGSTSLGICLPNEAVSKTTKEFMKVIGYRGILDVGYRYDARDGLYKVLDVNPRLGGTFRLFVAENGMDVVRAQYLDLTGQPVPESAPPSGRKWIVEDSDFVSCLRYYKDGKLTLKEWIKSFRGIREGAYLALDDPRPFFELCAGDIRNLFRRIFLKERVSAKPALLPESHSGTQRISNTSTWSSQGTTNPPP
jgi:D-aspartate ligase